MEFEMKPYIVYIKINENNYVTAINSSAFLSDLEGWVEIDSGFGDKYHHAQGNYFSKSLMDERGIYRYVVEESTYDIYEDGRPLVGQFGNEDKTRDFSIYERTEEEMDADYIEPVSTPSQLDIIEAQVTYTAMMTDTLLEG